MAEQESDLRKLMALARQGLTPDVDTQHAARARLEATFWQREVGPGGSGGELSTAAAPKADQRLWRWLQGGAVGLVLGATLGGYGASLLQAPPAAHTPSPPAGTFPTSSGDGLSGAAMPHPGPLPTPDSTLSRELGASVEPEPHARTLQISGEHAPSRGQRTQAQLGGGSAAPPAIDELVYVQRAQRALARHEAALALALFEELDQQLPRGRLREERFAGKAIARCLLDASQSEREARSFAQRYPHSVHSERVKQVCKSNDKTSSERLVP